MVVLHRFDCTKTQGHYPFGAEDEDFFYIMFEYIDGRKTKVNLGLFAFVDA